MYQKCLWMIDTPHDIMAIELRAEQISCLSKPMYCSKLKKRESGPSKIKHEAPHSSFPFLCTVERCINYFLFESFFSIGHRELSPSNYFSSPRLLSGDKRWKLSPIGNCSLHATKAYSAILLNKAVLLLLDWMKGITESNAVTVVQCNGIPTV